MTTKESPARKTISKIRGNPLSFGEMIASLRKTDDISQVTLAKKMKISKAYLCDIEKGRRHPTLEKAIEFAKVMGYSPIQFASRVLEDQARAAGLNVNIHLEVA